MDINDKAPEFTLPDQNGEQDSPRIFAGSGWFSTLPSRRHCRLHH